MYSKEELTSRNVAELKDIAKQIGAKIKSNDNKETIVYAILDTQAEQPAQPVKRKRVRISKKEDRVYSVKGKEGENYDVMKKQVKGPVKTSEAPLFKELPPLENQPEDAAEEVQQTEASVSDSTNEAKATAESTVEASNAKAETSEEQAPQTEAPNSEEPEVNPLAAFPKHRGRKSKAELEAIAAAKAAALQKQHEAKMAAQAQAEATNAQQEDTAEGATPNEQNQSASMTTPEGNTEGFIPEEQADYRSIASKDECTK